MASTEVSLQIRVDGAQRAVTDLAAVDAELRSGAASASAFGRANDAISMAHIARLRDAFRGAGIEINAASRSVQTIVSRMQGLERERAFRQLAQDANLSAVQIARLRYGMGDATGAAKTLASALLPGKLGLMALGAAAVYAAKACLDAQIAMQRLEQSYGAVFGAGAAAQLQAVYEQTDRVGLRFVETAEAARGFFAAGQGTSLAGDLDAIFRAVSDAGAALQLSTDDINGTFIALGQMMSKGKVQAEELRGQLGERLPGAFRMAAQAMGMTTAELDKFMADGRLTAEDLLPRLARALEDKYGKAAEKAADTVQGSLNRASTEWERFKAGLVNSDAAVFTINIVTKILKTVNDAEEDEARRAGLEARMRAAKIAPRGREAVYGAGILLGWNPAYSEEQYREQEYRDQIGARIRKNAEERMQREEKALNEFRAAQKTVAEKTLGGQLRALDEWKDEQIALAENARSYLADPGEADRMIADVNAQYSEKHAELLKKNASAAGSAAAAQAAYAKAVASAEAEIAGLQKQLALDPGEKLALAKAGAEAEYRKALAASNAEIDKRVAKGEYSAEEGERLRALQNQSLEMERQLALRDAEQAAHEENISLVQGQLDFYKELAALSGDYSASVKLQNELIDEQARKYRNILKIPPALVAEWERLARLQASVDPFDGAYRGLLRFTAAYSNEAKQWEDISYGFASDFESATRDMFDEFLDTGKASFGGLVDAFKATLKAMAYQALVQPIVVSVVQSVAGALYGSTTAGAGSAAGGGLAQSTAGALQNYAAGQVFKGGTSFLPESISGGISGILGTSLPGTTVPGLMGPTASGAALGGGLTIGSALGYGTFGSLGYGLLGGALGLPQNQYTGITSGLGGALGAWGASAALGGTALGATLGSVVPIVGTAIGALAGGLLGGLFGKKRKPRWGTDYSVNLWESATAAGQEQEYMAPDGKVRWKTAAGLSVASAAKNGAPDELENTGVDAVYDLLHAMQVQSGKIADMLGGVNAGMETAYLEALKAGGALAGSRWLKGGDITEENFRKYLEDIQAEAMGRMAGAMATIDLKPLTVAADGMAADTVDELSGALKSAFDYYDFGAQLFTDDALAEFQAGAQAQIAKAFADLDMSSLRVDFDQNSFGGLQQAYAAIQAWEQVTAGLKSVISPASELETTMAAATAQFDGWIDSLRSLGWQEEAIAEIEAKRARYLEEYRDAVVRASEQDLHLRQLALTSGQDSDEYAIRSLLYQQANEREEMAAKFGENSIYYGNLLEVQQAEMAKLRLDRFLSAQVDAARKTAGLFEHAVDALKRGVESLWTGDKNLLGTRYDEALKQFEETYARGMAGDSDALQSLPQIGQTVLELGKEQLASRGEYDDAFYDVAYKLQEAQTYAQNQLDTQQGLLDTLNAQLGVEQQTQLTAEQIAAEVKRLRAILEEELADVDRDEGLNGSRLPGPTGIYSSRYATESALLAAKVNTLNSTAYEGRTNWTASSARAEMIRIFGSVAEWYRLAGKAEGFAVGGITPVNEPFWVGENGPELMMSPRQYGVLNNADSMALMDMMRPAPGLALVGGPDVSGIIDELREVKSYLRQLVVKTDKTAYVGEKSLGLLRMWDAEGLPAQAAV